MPGLKSRTIRASLKKKMDHWLASLPTNLRDAIKNDIIVTGGSIASMLLGEPVNDYDVYLATNKSAYLLADHYCKEFIKRRNLKSGDTHAIPEVRMYYPEKMFTPETMYHTVDDPNLKPGIFIQSVGVISESSETTQEYRFFELEPLESTAMDSFTEEAFAVLDPVGNPALENAPHYRPVFMSQNAITLSDKIQVVLRFTGDPEKIHENFDYVHATNYYTYRDNRLELNSRALESLLSKSLRYSGSKYPICSLFRMRKFLDRGWRITAGEITKMAFQISELNMRDPSVLREQLTGVDAAYFHQLIRMIYSDRSNGVEIDSSYVMELIDSLSR